MGVLQAGDGAAAGEVDAIRITGKGEEICARAASEDAPAAYQHSLDQRQRRIHGANGAIEHQEIIRHGITPRSRMSGWKEKGRPRTRGLPGNTLEGDLFLVEDWSVAVLLISLAILRCAAAVTPATKHLHIEGRYVQRRTPLPVATLVRAWLLYFPFYHHQLPFGKVLVARFCEATPCRHSEPSSFALPLTVLIVPYAISSY